MLLIKMDFLVVMFLPLSFAAIMDHCIVSSWLVSLESEQRMGLQFVPLHWQSQFSMCLMFLIGH
jgi:hypothetical protein